MSTLNEAGEKFYKNSSIYAALYSGALKDQVQRSFRDFLDDSSLLPGSLPSLDENGTNTRYQSLGKIETALN